VDRLFAIWQALNPTSYTINKHAGDGTFVINRSSIETATTPLAPFADASGSKYWTSEGARQTTTFNYAYPETQRWAFSNDADYQNSVRNAVQQLYGGISNQFMLMSAPSPTPVATTIKAKAEESSADGSAQTASTALGVPSAEHDHLRDLVGTIKEGILGHSKEGTDGTRGLDLESEIGKCKLALASASSYGHMTDLEQLQLCHCHFQEKVRTENISSTSKLPSIFCNKATLCTYSSAPSTNQQPLGLHKMHLSVPSPSSGNRVKLLAAASASMMPKTMWKSLVL
jgi:hypothetical protein